MLFFQQKYVSFVFYLYLSPFFSFELRWPAAHFLISLSFTCSIFQICGHDNLSKLKTLDNTDTESISAFRFRLYWLFCCLCFYKTPVAVRFPAKISSSCIWVAIPVDWVILHCYACGADGRSLGVRSRDYQIFSDGYITSFSYPWCSAGSLRARELR